MLVGGLSRGSEGGRRDGLLGVVCHTYLLATQLGPQFTLYFYIIFLLGSEITFTSEDKRKRSAEVRGVCCGRAGAVLGNGAHQLSRG